MMARPEWMVDRPDWMKRNAFFAGIARDWDLACQKQHQKDIEELEKPCPHFPIVEIWCGGNEFHKLTRRECSICWQVWKEVNDGTKG